MRSSLGHVTSNVFTWVVPTTIDADFEEWNIYGEDLDATVQLDADNVEFPGPCAVADGSLIGLALPLGPLQGEADHSPPKSYLFVGVSDGARAYDLAIESVGGSQADEEVTIEVHCGVFSDGYGSTQPSNGSVEITSMPGPDGTPLTVVGTGDGNCVFDFEIAFQFPPDSFIE